MILKAFHEPNMFLPWAWCHPLPFFTNVVFSLYSRTKRKIPRISLKTSIKFSNPHPNKQKLRIYFKRGQNFKKKICDNSGTRKKRLQPKTVTGGAELLLQRIDITCTSPPKGEGVNLLFQWKDITCTSPPRGGG